MLAARSFGTLLVIYQLPLHCKTLVFISILLKCQISQRTLKEFSLKMISPWVFHILKHWYSDFSFWLFFFNVYCYVWSQDCIVSLVTGLWSGWSGVLILAGTRDFFCFPKMSWLLLGPTQPLIEWILGAFPRWQSSWSVRLTTPPSSAKVKNGWECTSTCCVCLHGMCRENYL
jgi:hypothetical protein